VSYTRLAFQITLAPKERWHSCLLLTPVIDGVRVPPRPHCYAMRAAEAPHEQEVRAYIEETTAFETEESSSIAADVLVTLEQARNDLAALRLFDLDRAPRAWTVAAGLPLYGALFGRDTLTTGWQAGLLGPEIMTGTLGTLAELQGTRLGYNSRDRSYGSITTSGLYALIVAELWHWTGDKELVRPFIDPALRALQWLETYGDIDGDGFYEYLTHSPLGPVHQAWKDSPDAIVYEDGTLVEPPIATTGPSPSASGATACTTACSRLHARSSTPRRCSNITACRSSSAASRATTGIRFPASTPTPIRCRPGPPPRYGHRTP